MKKVAIALIFVILCCTLCGCGLFSQSGKGNDAPSISISCGDTLSLKVDETIQLTAIVKGMTGTHKWESSDTSIVDVNSNGLLRAKRVGVAIVSVSIGAKFAATVVTVTENKEALTVELSCSKTNLLVGETATLSATVTPSKYSDLVQYHVQSGANVVSISNGTLTALAEGTATIYASVNDDVSKSITITVVDNRIIIESITLSIDKKQLKIGETATLSSTVVPSKYANLVEYYVENNTDYESLSNNITISGNVISAIGEGTVQIGAKIGAYRSNIVTVTIEGSSVVADSVTLSAEKYYITQGNNITLSATVVPSTMANLVKYEIVGSTNCAYISGNKFYATAQGDVQVVAKVGGTTSEPITIHIVAAGKTPDRITLTLSATSVAKGGYATLSFSVYPTASATDIEYLVIEGESNVKIESNSVHVLNTAPAKIVGRIGSVLSNVVEVNPNTVSSDPYTSESSSTFHGSNYTKATSYKDAQYRTDHNLMSGDITTPDQAPTIAENRPYYVQNGKTVFYRNSTVLFLDSGNTYIVFDADGYVVNLVYKGGAYITLEEVAAYVMAFGDVPANYYAHSKSYPSPKNSGWDKFFRVNHNNFSGSTYDYPYEPVLPNISGCGGTYKYKEIDIGTTGTDCDTKNHPSKIYNDGTTITRGAARIVYAQSDGGTKFEDINERYVFYTYNHYNDFQEYLNYQYGWGEMFGNITGGGTLSSKKDYNPTPYVAVAMHSFLNFRFA